MRQQVCVPELLIEATLQHEISEITYRELFQSNLPCWRGQCSPLAENSWEYSFFSTNKKGYVPTYCAAMDFPYFQALGIPKWTPAATPDTDEDIVQAHGHHLTLRCQRRSVSDPSNLRILRSLSRSDELD